MMSARLNSLSLLLKSFLNEADEQVSLQLASCDRSAGEGVSSRDCEPRH